MNESELIRRAQGGDSAAYDLLVQQHQQAVFRLAYLLLGERRDAEDIAQDAFIQAYRTLNRFDAERPLRPWLLRIVSNLASNRRRAIGRYLGALRRLVQAEGVIKPEREDPQSEEAQELWQAVRKLERADQEIIYLRYFLELSTAETAETLGIAEGTVKSRLSRTLSRLRTAMEASSLTVREGGAG